MNIQHKLPEHYRSATPAMTVATLNDSMIKLDNLGGGGEAVVYKVKRVADQEIFALRLDEEARQLNIAGHNDLHNRLLNISTHCPHISKIEDIFWVKRRNYYYFGDPIKGVGPFGKLYSKPTGFFDETFEEDSDARVFHHQALLMPVAEGELSFDIVKKMYGEQTTEKTSRVYWEAQRAILSLQLQQIGLSHQDGNKLRNYVYFKAEHDEFQGQSLSNFSHWQYQIGGTQIYVPIGPYSMRRIDFGCWMTREPKKPAVEDLKDDIARIAENNDMTASEVFELLKKPDQDPQKIIKVDLDAPSDEYTHRE